MTQTCETTNLMTPTRPRLTEALPVLISIPNLAGSSLGSRPRPQVRRRRLRREIRVAGYALLAILPASMAFVAFAGERLPTLAAGLTVERRVASVDPTARPASVISLEPLEPVVISVGRELESPVILPGILLPADTPEESSDGGH